MAKKPSTIATLSASAAALLVSIAAATEAGENFMLAPSDDARFLAENGYIDVNTEITDEAGNAAARVTEKGAAEAANHAPAEASAGSDEFDIETGVAPTARRRTRTREDTYPFDKLPAPAADGTIARFFIPATAERPKPWESLASTVSSASARYRTKTGEETYTSGKGETKTRNVYDYERKFALVPGEKNGVKGAYVERVK